MSARYSIKPKADQDLDDHADYLAREASIDIALRFLGNAHETFLLLSSYPNMGWESRLAHVALRGLRVFRVSRFENMLILYRPLQGSIEVLRVVHGSRNLRALFRRRAAIE